MGSPNPHVGQAHASEKKAAALSVRQQLQVEAGAEQEKQEQSRPTMCVRVCVQACEQGGAEIGSAAHMPLQNNLCPGACTTEWDTQHSPLHTHPAALSLWLLQADLPHWQLDMLWRVH